MTDHTYSTQNNTSNRDQSSTKVTEEPKIRSSIPKPSKRKRPYQFSWIPSSRGREANPGLVLSKQRGRQRFKGEKIELPSVFEMIFDESECYCWRMRYETWSFCLNLLVLKIWFNFLSIFDEVWHLNIDFCSCNLTPMKQRAKISEEK